MAPRIVKNPVQTSTTVENGRTTINYRGTNVVSFDENEIVLNTGGWRSNTTKHRMNQANHEYALTYGVYIEKGVWFVHTKAGSFEFRGNRVKIDRKTGEVSIQVY